MEVLQTFFGLIGLGFQWLWRHIDLNFDEVFLRVLDLSKVGILVILAVLVLRFLLRKAPKICSYVLWAVVLFRLLCPVGLEVDWGVVSTGDSGTSYTLANDDISFAGAAGAAVRAVGDAANGGLGIQHIRTTGGEVISSHWWEVWILFGKYVWAAGVLAMVLCAALSYRKLRKKLRLSMPLPETWADEVVNQRPTVFLADGITTAFVVGLFRPKIYLPSDLPEEERQYILLHECHHVKRGDHIWKLLGFIALCVHWFNPLVWMAFHLACKDMEMSCDEAVLKRLGPEIRRDYSASLLRLSTGRRFTAAMPLAFGEGDTGDRVRHVMKYKKPALWLTATAALLALVTVVLLSTNRASQNTELLAASYRTTNVVYSVDGIGGPTESGPLYAITVDHQLYRKNQEAEPWNYVGTLEPYDLSKKELENYTATPCWTTSYRLREITDAYFLSVENDMFYVVCQTKNGDTLLGYGWEDLGERGDGASDDTSLTFLYLLEPTGDAETAIGLSMTSLLSQPLNSLGLQHLGDHYVWGFSTGEEYRDWGYAIFKEYGGAFKLLDWHLYENAALAQNQIYVCPDPAVLSDDGTMTDENTYDVILNCNMQLDRIVRTVTVDGAVHHTVEKQNINGSSLILFNWAEQDTPKAHSVSQHFYDKWGGEIEASSLTQEDRTLSVFQWQYPGVEPIDWVTADDGAQDLLGVVIFSEKAGSTEFAFVRDSHCAQAGLDSTVLSESDLIYEGNATVSVILQNQEGALYKEYMSYACAEEERTTYFEHWDELIQDAPAQATVLAEGDDNPLLERFHQSQPDVEPLDWVLASDGAEGLLGVVLFAGKNGGTEFAFVKDQVCGVMGLGAKFTAESDLVYEGNGIVSVVLQHTDGELRKTSMAYSESDDGSDQVNSWDELLKND